MNNNISVKILFLIISSMIIIACSDKDKFLSYDEELLNTDAKEINLKRLALDDALIYSDIFSNVRYVPLETKEDVLISRITKLQVANNGDFLIFDDISGSILRFNSNGKFLNHIGYRGSGNNEYIYPTDMLYDKYENQVIVFDNGKHDLMYFSLNGKLLKKTKLPWVISVFGIIDNNRLAVYMNYDEDLSNKEKGYNFRIIDFDGNVIKEFAPFTKEQVGFSTECRSTFSYYKDELLCMKPFSSLVFTLTQDSIIPKYNLSFGEDRVPKEWLGTDKFYENLRKYENIVFCSKFFESNNYIIMNLVRNKVLSLCVVRKDKMDKTYVGNVTINDLYGFVGGVSVCEVSNNNIYFSVDPSSFDAYRDIINKYPLNTNIANELAQEASNTALDVISSIFGQKNPLENYVKQMTNCSIKISKQDKELIEQIGENDNPVIQVCTLK